jgi:uncharacterized protein (DUF1778 family)
MTKTELIKVRLTEVDRQLIERLATRRGLSMSGVMITLIREAAQAEGIFDPDQLEEEAVTA